MSKAAPQRVTVEVSMSPSRVLIVDDEKPFLDRARSFFASRGYDVDVARTPELALPLLQEHAKAPKYRIVITDDNFDTLSKIKGHRFILDNKHLLGEAKPMIISGAEEPSEGILEELKAINCEYVEKNETLNAFLNELTKEDHENRNRELKNTVKDALQGVLPNLSVAAGGPAEVEDVTDSLEPYTEQSFSDETHGALKRMIVNWLQSRGSLNEPVFYYGDNVYSANEMIRQVEDETEIGREHIMMLLAEFEYSQENKEDVPPKYLDDDD